MISLNSVQVGGWFYWALQLYCQEFCVTHFRVYEITRVCWAKVPNVVVVAFSSGDALTYTVFQDLPVPTPVFPPFVPPVTSFRFVLLVDRKFYVFSMSFLTSKTVWYTIVLLHERRGEFLKTSDYNVTPRPRYPRPEDGS